MKQAEEAHRWFFVDEAGSPAFYGKGRKLIVGTEGCSYTFSVGFLRTLDPQSIRDALSRVRALVAADSYLKSIPSLRKSLISFHAKDDCPEVRKLVFDCLKGLNFGAQVVVARKVENIFKGKHQGREDRFYDDLVARLFERQLHLARHNTVVFSRRGNKTRQHALRSALETAAKIFRAKYGAELNTSFTVETNAPAQETVLQACDYVLWSVQRAFERQEMRYFDFLREKIEMVWDIYDFAKQKSGSSTVYDRKKNLFDIKNASPLG